MFSVAVYLISFMLLIAAPVHAQTNHTAIPRWGQATAIIYSTLFVYGGKTDPEHQYTYTSAPNNNDLLSLDLTSSFSLTSPPWSYVAGSQIRTSSQGPAVAFHTLTPYTSSELLLFGGDAGFSIIETNADSAWLLGAKDRLSPTWSSQPAGWASEPIRRIYHAAPSAAGAVYILGGQKADGSQIGFPDPYLFNAVADNGSPSFIALSDSTGAPSGLFGHTAHFLPDGLLVVFGGFFSTTSTPNTPSPLSTIYILNTTSAFHTWSTLNASGTILSARRGFASVLLADGKILIHGGADAGLQTVYNDGAILDTTQTPMIWSPVTALSDTLGHRVGHFATCINDQVLFGFGWAGNSPAGAELVLYDLNSSTFQSTYSPSPTAVPITSLPVSPTAPGGTYPTSAGQGVSGLPSSGSDLPTGSRPTKTSGPGDGQGNKSTDTKTNVTGVILGSVFGFLALGGLVGGTVYYALQRRERRGWMGIDVNTKKDVEARWSLMPEEDPWDTTDADPTATRQTVQIAGTSWAGQTRRSGGLLGLAALIGVRNHHRTLGRRRDMLADEDARQYDIDSIFLDGDHVTPGYLNTISLGKRREGTGGSSIPSERSEDRPVWTHLWNASVTNLKNVGAALGVTTTGAAAAQNGRGQDVNPSEWWEKDELPLDPFTNKDADELPMRPRGGQDSTQANLYSDPFADPYEANARDEGTANLLVSMHDEDTTSSLGDASSSSTSRDLFPQSYTTVNMPRDEVPCSGSSERGIRNSVDSQEALSSRDTQSTSTAKTKVGTGSSTEYGGSLNSPLSPRTTSIIGVTSAPMRRSDSWWSRFSRTAFLDRHAIPDNPREGLAVFRDPNPPPRLRPIEESIHSSPQATLSESSPSTELGGDMIQLSKRNAGSGYAASTKSSIRTELTADSELIARLDGRMEVVQRALSLRSNATASPTTTLRSMDSDEQHKWGSAHRRSWTGVSSTDTGSFTADSPVEESPSTPHHVTSKSEALTANISQTDPAIARLVGPRPPRRTLTGAIAARVSAYERRMSEDTVLHNGPRQSHTVLETRRKEDDDASKRRSGVGYGFVPKTPLFVANPDHGSAGGSA